MNIIEILKGKKTYIAGFSLLVYAIIQKDIEMILTALSILGLRAGIAKSN